MSIASIVREKMELADKVLDLMAENRRLREALSVYADQENWSLPTQTSVCATDFYPGTSGESLCDGWRLARRALDTTDDSE